MFDLAGTVKDFVKACRHVAGFEFLADIADEEVEPDEDFYVEKRGRRTDDSLPQTLYLVMTNAQAVNELIRLFTAWQADPSTSFPRGLAPLKQVFALLRSIRRWGPEDRVRETGLLEEWRGFVELAGQMTNTTRVEIELWHRTLTGDRERAEAHVRDLVTRAGGTVLSGAQIAGIHYHALLAELPRQQVEQVLHDGAGSIELLSAEDVMFVGPATPMAVPSPQPSEAKVVGLGERPANGPPRVALLDGLPLAQHVALAGRLVIDDPDDVAVRYSDPSAQRHGTAMASLIIHGDLNAPSDPLPSPLYVRPVLEPRPWPPDSPEQTPADQLLVDLIHRSFVRMLHGDGSRPAAAPNVRVVNLSIGDPSRVFVRRMSPLARLLDWLAHKHNVVVVVSSGNHDVSPQVPAEVLFDPEARAAAVTRDLYERALLRRMLSPAESINAITVGSTSSDEAPGSLPDTVIDLTDPGAPAPYSAIGSGFRRAVKPEVLAPGGRIVFVRPVETEGITVLKRAETSGVGPGVKAAAPGLAGELDSTSFGSGTSNSAALTTRYIAYVLEDLDQLAGENGWEFLTPQYRPALAKTLLVHAAAWGEAADALAARLGLAGNSRRAQLAQLLGYGAVDPDRVATADRVRAVLVHANSIAANEQHVYRFPLPPSLAASIEWRRLTVTLGWLTPISSRSQRYRGASVSVDLAHDVLGLGRVEVDTKASRRGTLQHEVFTGTRAVAFQAGDVLELRVECKADAGERIDGSGLVRYGLAVSLEVSPSLQVDIHEQVANALRARVRPATRARVSSR